MYDLRISHHHFSRQHKIISWKNMLYHIFSEQLRHDVKIVVVAIISRLEYALWQYEFVQIIWEKQEVFSFDED